jgi:hypothetical protein
MTFDILDNNTVAFGISFAAFGLLWLGAAWVTRRKRVARQRTNHQVRVALTKMATDRGDRAVAAVRRCVEIIPEIEASLARLKGLLGEVMKAEAPKPPPDKWRQVFNFPDMLDPADLAEIEKMLGPHFPLGDDKRFTVFNFRGSHHAAGTGSTPLDDAAGMRPNRPLPREPFKKG